jgi:hypothetical protein
MTGCIVSVSGIPTDLAEISDSILDALGHGSAFVLDPASGLVSRSGAVARYPLPQCSLTLESLDGRPLRRFLGQVLQHALDNGRVLFGYLDESVGSWVIEAGIQGRSLVETRLIAEGLSQPVLSLQASSPRIVWLEGIKLAGTIPDPTEGDPFLAVASIGLPSEEAA